jgi:hypothetical protein
MITQQELEGIARQALNMARTASDQNRWETSIVLASYHEADGRLHRMEKVERLLLEKLGPGWLGDEGRKDVGFSVIREGVDYMPPDAIVIVAPADFYRPAAKMLALPEGEQRRLFQRSYENRRQMIDDGLLKCIDSFNAVAQTPELVIVCNQAADGETAPESHCFAQDEFDGRWKMFGVSKMMGYGKEADAART